MEADMRLLGIALLGLASAAAQTPAQPQQQQAAVASANAQPQTLQTPQQEAGGNWVTVPAGTKVLLVLKNSISSKNAKKGDGVYLESSFPITQDGQIVIPAGTFVQGVIDEVKRPGRVKGRGEILMHFTSLVYPNGYTVTLPSSGVESTDSSDSQTVADKEGTVKGGGSKGRDTATVATATATGAGIGAAAGGWKGAGIGSGIGAAAGLGAVLLTRGEDVRLYQGTTVEMVLNRPLKLDATRIDSTNRQHFIPVRELQQLQRLVVPTTVGDGPIVR
jgi:type IV secretion system protein VirB10